MTSLQRAKPGSAGTGRSHRPRHWPRWVPSPRVLIAVLSLVVLGVLVLRERSAQHDFLSAFKKVRLDRSPWLALALASEAASLGCYAMAQRRLLAAGGAHLKRSTLYGLTFAATGLSAIVPAGVVPASGWLIEQYRRREVPLPLAVWSVLAGGFAATVSVLVLLLIGAGAAGIGKPLLLVAFGVILISGSSLFVILVHHLDSLERLLARHHYRRGLRLVHWLACRTSDIVSYRATLRGGTEVFAWSILNWVLDSIVLALSFAFLGLPVPWRASLFAYPVSQLAASLVPSFAGIGVVAGGLVGAFALAGVSPGEALVATTVYRVVSYWLVAGAGILVLVWINHHPPSRLADLDPAARRPARRPGPVEVAVE